MQSKKQKSKRGWKILFGYLFEYKKEVILLSFLGVVSALANGTAPYIIGRFFDAILGNEIAFVNTIAEMPLWLFLIFVFLLVQVVANFMDWILSKRGGKLSLDIYASYIAKAKSSLLFLPIKFHTGKKIGEIEEKISRGGNSLDNMIDNVVLKLTPQFLSILVGFIIVFSINFKVGVMLVLGVLSYVFILMKIASPMSDFIKKGNKAWSKAHGYSYDAVSNIDTIKKFTTEEVETKKIYDYFVNKASRAWYKVMLIWNNIDFYQRIIVTITQVSIFLVSVFLIQKGEMTIGELIMLNGYTAMVFGPFVVLGNNWQVIQTGLVDIEIVDKILGLKKEEYKPKNAVHIKSIKGNIEFKDVSFYYNKKDGDILKGINFKVKAGETIALVGESGVGKSTLIDLISAYYFAQKGKVLIDGVDVKKINLKFLRRAIAVVPQEVTLFNDTVKTNIRYGNFKAKEKDIKFAAKEAHADVFIEKFPKKYKQLVGERGVKLSVGQKQRIAIARAILRDPKILILDEPTSALDSKSEKYITESLEKLMQGRTTFIIAHRLSTVRKADRILVFKDGKIVEQGSHKELMNIKNGIYKKLYTLHIGLE